MEVNITENLVKEKLAEFENKEHAEDLFKDKE